MNSCTRLTYESVKGTDLRVSNLSLGTSGFCHFYGTFDENECIEATKFAIAQGINYIDTAPWYGDGKSEQVLGRALQNVPRDKFYIATKIGRYSPELDKMFDFGHQKTLSSIENSLRNLKLSYVDILQIHDIEFGSMEILLNECLPALEEILVRGKARYIGITGYPLEVLKNFVLKVSPRYRISTVLSYSRLTMFDSSLLDYLSFFQEQQIGVINAAPHGMGLLTNRGAMDWHPASEPLKNVCRDAADFCKERGTDLAKLSLHYSLQKKGICTHLVGMNNKNLVAANLEIAKNGLSLSEMSTFAEVKEKFEKSGMVKVNWEGVEVERYKTQMQKLKQAD